MSSFSEGCKMLLVGFIVWAIVCLRHSWKVMWTRLADWLVMSNSLPQREDELLCGLHGWVVSMWVQSCAHIHLGTHWKQVDFLYVQDANFQTFHLAFLSPLEVQAGKRSISEVRVTYAGPSADVTVSELRETRAVGSECGQGPSFRDAMGPSFSVHFSLLHLVSST